MNCPYCGARNDTHVEVDGTKPPEPGDISVCLHCGSLGVFAEDGSIRKATDEEQVTYLLSDDVDAKIKRAMQIARLYQVTFGRKQ